MDFAFTEEQQELRRQARAFLDRTSDSATIRRLMETEVGYDTASYARMAELGWTGIPFAEADGGAGLGLVDLTVVLEETGRHLTPSPLLSTVTLAGATIAAAGDGPARSLLPGIADGSHRATVAVLERNGRWDAAGVCLDARRRGDRYVLRGGKRCVSDAAGADTVIVVARTTPAQNGGSDGVSLFAVPAGTPGVEVRRHHAQDHTQRLFAVDLHDVEVGQDSIVGAVDRGWAALRHGLQSAAVGVCAELCGVMQRTIEMSVEYANTRHQFGRPIGTNQAVSHRCADMLVQSETAKSLTYHAAWAVDAGDPEVEMAVSMAKAWCSDAAQAVTGGGIQVHGGIGFTWEHDMHLLYRRAAWGAHVYGDASSHRERVAQLLDI